MCPVRERWPCPTTLCLGPACCWEGWHSTGVGSSAPMCSRAWVYLGNGAVWSENSFLLFLAQISASGEAVHWVGEAPRRCCSVAVRPRPLLAGAAVEPPHGHSSAWQPRHDPTSPAGCRGGPLARTSVGTVSPLRLLLTGRGFRPVPVTVSHHLRGSCCFTMGWARPWSLLRVCFPGEVSVVLPSRSALIPRNPALVDRHRLHVWETLWFYLESMRPRRPWPPQPARCRQPNVLGKT